MGHKEWETDDFLDEFLDFDYRKPVPGHGEGKHSRGLPAEEVKQSKQENKDFGLGKDFDDYKAYEALRHRNDGDAGAPSSSSVKEETKGLRSSGAFKPEIMEPLSAKRAEKTSAPKAEPADVSREQKKAAAAPSGLKGMLFGKHKHVNAAELASEALGAAKKLVTSDEDIPPEEIPPASAASLTDIENLNSSGSSKSSRSGILPGPGAEPEKPKDELAELFAELGEGGAQPLTTEDNEALRQAQQDAYDRYRGEPTDKQVAVRSAFTFTVAAMQALDEEQLAAYKEAFGKQKKYRTLRGYIFAQEYKKNNQNA